MIRPRLQLAAFTTLAAILLMTAAPLAQALHQTCMLPHHDCGSRAKIAACCCDDRAGRSESTPVEGRIDIRASETALTVRPHTAVLDPTSIMARVAGTWSPPLCRLDLPTLFAALLI